MQEVAVDGTFRMPTTSHAVVHQGLVFVTGTLATRGSSFEVIGTGIRAETEQTIRNISEILAECGSGLERILKTTVYLRDVEDFLDMDAAYGELLPGRPARTTVYVAAMPLGAAIEIDAIAVTESAEQQDR